MSEPRMRSPGDAQGRLRALRDGLSLAQISVAVATVAAAGGFRAASLALAAALVLWAFVRPLPKVASLRSQRAWTAGVLVALVATAVRAWTTAELLESGLDFLLLLVVQRFFNRQGSREHLQLLLLGALLLVAGAVINAGLNYPVLFAAYLLLATMTLLLNHLMSEGERLGPRTAASLAKETLQVQPILWRAGAQVAGIAVLGAVVTFVAFPRWGVGMFLRGGMARDVHSGFSDRVELGEFGRIKTDGTVVLRIQPRETEWGPEPSWHLRGSSFDTYERGRWSHGDGQGHDDGGNLPAMLRAAYGYRALADRWGITGLATWQPSPDLALAPIAGFADSTLALHATATLEDLGVDVLFLASTPVAARLSPRGLVEERNRIRGGINDEVRVDKAPGPVRYQFVSRIGTPTPAELRAVGQPASDPTLAPYLQRAPGVSPELGELAGRLTAGAVTRYDQVAAVMDHLAGFTYSLDAPPSARIAAGADPIEGFIFETRAGHCEYFASALALLLREVDVPTRLVNGYYGAHHNPVGGYYAVRQADAHSWVEVYFGPLGWVTFDPTPPAGRTAGKDAPWWPAAAQWVDALRNGYLNWVIDYDLGKQLTLFGNLGLRDQEATSLWRRWKPLFGWASGVAMFAFAVLTWRRWRSPKVDPRVRSYERLLRALARRGHVPELHESPRRFCARVGAQEAHLRDTLNRFARDYEALRFGPEPGREQVAKLGQQVSGLIEALGPRRRTSAEQRQ